MAHAAAPAHRVDLIALRLRPWLAAAAVYGALTAVLTYPLVRVAASAVTWPGDDPLLNSWILWWNSEVPPLTSAWWNAPMFYPTAGTLAFSEHLLGLVPLAAPILWWSDNPVLAHNVLVLISFPLSALSAHALAFQLTRRHDAAVLAGLAFGFSPYRANELGHVQMLSYYWAPLALVALHRYVRDSRGRWVVLFAGACLLQALCNGYALFHLPVLLALWVAWFARSRRQAVVIALAWAGGMLVLAPILSTYADIQSGLHLSRSITDVRAFSADIGSLISAPPDARFLGAHPLWYRSYGLFPGLTAVLILAAAGIHRWRQRRPALAPFGRDRLILGLVGITCGVVAASVGIVGPWRLGPLSVSQAYKPLTMAIVFGLACAARGPWWRRTWRERSVAGFYALGIVAMYVLAFGPEPRLFGHRVFYQAPYAWLMQLPGFDAIRAPDRFAFLAALCLGIVIALAYARWNGLHRRAIWGALCLGLVADGWIRVTPVALPAAGPPGPWGEAAAILELPLWPERDASALFRSIRYGLPLVNGASGYSPPHYTPLTDALRAGELEVVTALAAHGAIGIGVDRRDAGWRSTEAALVRLEGVTPLVASADWGRFLLRATTLTPHALGPALPIAEVRATHAAPDATRVIDGRLDTAWSSGEQTGLEEITIELRDAPVVTAAVLRLGACAGGYPRVLSIDASQGGSGWTTVFAGRTAVAAARGALAEPSEVPVVLTFDAVETRRMRFRQLGRDLAVPWCVAELSVHGRFRR
jgi:hypothetical protein